MFFPISQEKRRVNKACKLLGLDYWNMDDRICEPVWVSLSQILVEGAKAALNILAVF